MAFWPIFLYISLVGQFKAKADSCEQDLPMPNNALDNRDTSGVRPTIQPPIQGYLLVLNLSYYPQRIL